MTQHTAQFVGSIPENYDAGLGPHIFVDYARDLSRRVEALSPGRVLELAAGTGIVTRTLRDVLGDTCAIVATDLNPPMLDVAKRKFADGDNVTFEPADAMALPFGDASFDVIACQFGVMFFPDKLASYREAARVLKPGGAYVFNVWGSLDDNPFAAIAHETVESFFPDDPPQFYRTPFGYHDGDAIRGAVLDAGFEDVSVASVRLSTRVHSPDMFAKGLVFGNPLYDEIVSRGGDPERIYGALLGAIRTKLADPMPLHALVVQASKA